VHTFAKYGLICLASGLLTLLIAFCGADLGGPRTIPQVVLMFIGFAMLAASALLILSVLVRAAFPLKHR
jgi:hypothetical protein